MKILLFTILLTVNQDSFPEKYFYSYSLGHEQIDLVLKIRQNKTFSLVTKHVNKGKKRVIVGDWFFKTTSSIYLTSRHYSLNCKKKICLNDRLCRNYLFLINEKRLISYDKNDNFIDEIILSSEK